ncbi:hypothetical protein KBA27_05305 [bacterium]|nr:hypothetical protein [bacterium]
MKKVRVKELKESIKEKELQMAKLKVHADKSAICSDLYNKVILEKAILNEELKEIEQNFFFQKMKKIIPHRKNLICDYFKGE